MPEPVQTTELPKLSRRQQHELHRPTGKYWASVLFGLPALNLFATTLLWSARNSMGLPTLAQLLQYAALLIAVETVATGFMLYRANVRRWWLWALLAPVFIAAVTFLGLELSFAFIAWADDIVNPL